MLLVLVSVLACEAGGVAGTCEVSQDAGTATATVDGEAWTGEGAAFTWAGTSLQLNTVGSGSWWMSLVAQTTTDGDTLQDAVDSGAFPLTVSLTDGGWATFYPDEGGSYTSREGSGELVIAEADESAVRGCFSFEAVGDDGTVAVEAGTIDAQAG